MSDLGGGGSSQSTSSSGPVYLPNPVTDFDMQLAQMDQSIGTMLVDWGLTQFNNLVALTDPIIKSLTGMASNLYQQANQYYSTFENEFQPIINQWVNDAETYASAPRIAQAEGEAESQENQAMDQARIAAESNLESMGISPDSGRYQDLELAQRTQGAAAGVGQAELARQRIEDTGRQMREFAINTGMQYPAMSVNAANAGTQANSIAGQIGIGRLTAGANAVNTGAPWKAPYVTPPIGQQSKSQSSSHQDPKKSPEQQQKDNSGNQNGKGNNNNPPGPPPVPPPKADPGQLPDPGFDATNMPPQVAIDPQGTFTGIPFTQDNWNELALGQTAGPYSTNPNGILPYQDVPTNLPGGDYGGQQVYGQGYQPPAWDTSHDNANAPQPANWGAPPDTATPGATIGAPSNPDVMSPNSTGAGNPFMDAQPATNMPNIYGSDQYNMGPITDNFDNSITLSSQGTQPYYDPSTGIDLSQYSGDQMNQNTPYDPNASIDLSQYNQPMGSDTGADFGGGTTASDTMSGAPDMPSFDTSGSGTPDTGGGLEATPTMDTTFDPSAGMPTDSVSSIDTSSPSSSGIDTSSAPVDYSGDYGFSDSFDVATGGAIGYAGGGRVPPPSTGGRVTPNMSPSRGAQTDDIPARLNAGEYVIPRDVAAWKGHEFFDRLIAKSRQARATTQVKPQTGQPLPNQNRPTFRSQGVQGAAPGGAIRGQVPPMARPFAPPRFVPPARGRTMPQVRPGNFAGAPYGRFGRR